MSVVEITSKEQFDALLASDKLFFIDFYTEWCGPCKMISPVFQQLANEMREADFYKLNIDNVPSVAQELGIHAIPTFHGYKGSQRIDVVRGANRDGLTALVQKGFSFLQ